MMLNESAIRTAQPGIIWCGSLRGFGLRTGKNVKTFIVRVAHGRNKRIGRYPLTSLADARSTAKKLLAEKVLGNIVPTHTAYESARDDFLKDCETRLRPSTLYLYTRNLTKFFRFGRQSIAGITPKQITGSLKGLPPSEKEHAYRIGRTFFTWAFREHLIDRSPFERLEPPPQGKSRERTLDEDELKKVYEHACKLVSAMQRLVWCILRLGQRPGETRHLKRAYIASDRIKLPGDITKNKRDHTFPISKETYDTLMSFPQIDDSDYLFPSARTHVRGKPVYVMAATSRECQQFRDECKTSDWTLHDLRRTVATHWEKLGIPVQVTEAMLNHVSGSKAGVTGIYQRHKYFPEMQSAFALWHEKLAHL